MSGQKDNAEKLGVSTGVYFLQSRVFTEHWRMERSTSKVCSSDGDH